MLILLYILPVKELLPNNQLYEHYVVINAKKNFITIPKYWNQENSITNRYTKRLYNPINLASVSNTKTIENIHNEKLLFISSDIKSSFFDTEGLALDTIIKLIDIYKNYGIDSKKDIMPKSKLEVLYEKSLSNQKAEEKILYTALTTNKKAINLYRYKLKNGKEVFFNKEGISLKNSKIFINPLNGDFRISSKFGNRKHPIRGKVTFHKGIDYAAKLGTPIYAAAEGIIEYIGNNLGYGKFIKVKHQNGYSTCYAHISKFDSNLKLGSKVKQGQIIAYVGSTGIATGSHLHYEVIYNGKHIDPLTIVHKDKVKLSDNELIEFKLFVSKLDKMINSSFYIKKALY